MSIRLTLCAVPLKHMGSYLAVVGRPLLERPELLCFAFCRSHRVLPFGAALRSAELTSAGGESFSKKLTSWGGVFFEENNFPGGGAFATKPTSLGG